jgi:hypothetical protein
VDGKSGHQQSDQDVTGEIGGQALRLQKELISGDLEVLGKAEHLNGADHYEAGEDHPHGCRRALNPGAQLGHLIVGR